MSKIKPLHDKVIIKREDKEQTTESGIILSGEIQVKPLQGLVVAAGPDALDVKYGDYVMFAQGGDEVILEGETYLMISESLILGVIEKDE